MKAGEVVGSWERAGEVEGDHVVIGKLESILKKEKANRVEWFRVKVCVPFSCDISMNGHLFYKNTELSWCSSLTLFARLTLAQGRGLDVPVRSGRGPESHTIR